MDEVLSQAPLNVSQETIKAIFDKNNKEVLPTLMELWEIKEVQKNKTKWDEVRETCDAYDTEMQTLISNAKKQAYMNK